VIDMAQVRTRAAALGFSGAGAIPAAPAATLPAYERWIDAGMHADMGYMARPDRVARRRDLTLILPDVRTLVLVTCDYGAALPPGILDDPARGRIAAYAWGADYHPLMTERLHTLARELGAAAGGAYKVYVDTGAVLERAHAAEAGLGFIGKNTMLIDPRRGSRFFLGVLLTNAPCDSYTAPAPLPGCGTCTRCLAACPTDAFPAPHVLDARRCISYWTIEHKGAIDPTLRPRFGRWVYGCDVCQDVCPWNRFAPPTGDPAFLPIDADRAAPPLRDLLTLDDDGFRARFAGSAIVRTGRERLVRNACVAAGNSGQRALIPALRALAAGESRLIREHALWALDRLEA
jgi:epoxyqueuosine reductase